MEYEPGKSHYPKAESRGNHDFLRHQAGKNKRKRNATLTQESCSLHFEGQRYHDGNTEAPKSEYRSNMADLTYMENHRPNKASYTMYSPILDRKSGANKVSRTGDFCSKSKPENDHVAPQRNQDLPRYSCLHDHSVDDSDFSGKSQGHLISAYEKNITKNCKLSNSSHWDCGIHRKVEYLCAKERQSDPALVKRYPQNSHSEPKQYAVAEDLTHSCGSDSDTSDTSTSKTLGVNSGRCNHKTDGYNGKTFRLKTEAIPCDLKSENHPYRRLERKYYINNRKSSRDKHTARDDRSSVAKCDVKPFNTTILYDVKASNKSTSDVKPCTTATSTDVKPYTTATICAVKPYSKATVCNVKPFSTAAVCDVKPHSVSTRRDVKPFTAATTHEVKPYTAECDVTSHKASTYDIEPSSTKREVNKRSCRPYPTPRDSRCLAEKRNDTTYLLEKPKHTHTKVPVPTLEVSSNHGDFDTAPATSRLSNTLDPHRREDSARTPWTCTKWVDPGDKAWTCEVYSDTAIPEVASAHVVKTYIDNRKPKLDHHYQQRFPTCREVGSLAQCSLGSMDESRTALNPGNSVNASRQTIQQNSFTHTDLNGSNEFKCEGEFASVLKDNNASNTHVQDAPYLSEALRLMESRNYTNEDTKEQTSTHHSENEIGSWIENKLRPNQTLTMDNQVVNNPPVTSCAQSQYITYLKSETFKPISDSSADSNKNDSNLRTNQPYPEDTRHGSNNEQTAPRETNMLQCKYEKRNCLTDIIEKMNHKNPRAKSVDKSTQSETVYALIAGHPVPIISTSDTENATYYTASTSGFDKNQISLRSSILAEIPNIFDKRGTDIQDKISYEEYKSGRKRYAERQEKQSDYEIEELTYEIENNTDRGKQIHCRSKCHLSGKKYGPNIKPHLHFNYTKSSDEKKIRRKSPLGIKAEKELSYTNNTYVDRKTPLEVNMTNDGEYVTCEESCPKQTSSSPSDKQPTIRVPRRKQKSPDVSQRTRRKKRRKRKTPVPLSAKSSKISVSETSVYKGKRKRRKTPRTARSATNQSSEPVFVIAKPGASAHKSVSKVDEDTSTKGMVNQSLSIVQPPLPSGGKGMEPIQRTTPPTEPYKMNGKLIIPNPKSRITRRLVEGSKENERKKATQVVNVPTCVRTVEQQCSTNELLQDGARGNNEHSAFTRPGEAPYTKQFNRHEKRSRFEEQNQTSESEQVSTLNTSELNASIMRLYEEIHKLKLQLDASTDASISSCGPYLDQYDISPTKVKKERDEMMKNSSASSSKTRVPLKRFRQAQSPGSRSTAKQSESKPKSFKVKLFQTPQKEERTSPQSHREDAVKNVASPSSPAGNKFDLAKADKRLKFCQQSPAKLRPRQAERVKDYFDPKDPQPCFKCVRDPKMGSGSVRDVERSYGSDDDFTSQDSSSEPIAFRKMKSETGQDSSSGGSAAHMRSQRTEDYVRLRNATPDYCREGNKKVFHTSHFVLTAKDDYSPVETCFTGSSCMSRSSSEADQVSDLEEEDSTLRRQYELGNPPDESSSARLKRLDERIQLLLNSSSPASSNPSQTSQLFGPGPSQIIGDGKHVDNCSNKIIQHVLPHQLFSNYSSPNANYQTLDDSDRSLSQSTSYELHCSVCESSPASPQDHPTQAKSESAQNNDNNSRLDDAAAGSNSSQESVNTEQNIPVSMTCGKLKIFGLTRDTTIQFYKNTVLELPEVHQKMSRMLMPQLQSRSQNQTMGESSVSKSSKAEPAASNNNSVNKQDADLGSASALQGRADGDQQLGVKDRKANSHPLEDKTPTSGDTGATSAMNKDSHHINANESGAQTTMHKDSHHTTANDHAAQKDTAHTENPNCKIPPRDQNIASNDSSPYIRMRSLHDEQIVSPSSGAGSSQADILPGITIDAIDMTTKKFGIDLNTKTKDQLVKKFYEPNDSYSDFHEAEAPVEKKKMPLNSRRMYNKNSDSKQLHMSSARRPPQTQRNLNVPTVISPDSSQHSQQPQMFNSTKSDAFHNPSNDRGKGHTTEEITKDRSNGSEPLTPQQYTNPGMRAATGKNDRTFVVSDTHREMRYPDNKQREPPSSYPSSAENFKNVREGERRHTQHSAADSVGNSSSSEAYAGCRIKSEMRNLGSKNPQSSSDAPEVAEPGQGSVSGGVNTPGARGQRKYIIQLTDNKSHRINANNSYDSNVACANYADTSRERTSALRAKQQLSSDEKLGDMEQHLMRSTHPTENCNDKSKPDTHANGGPKARRRLKIPYQSGSGPSEETPALDPSYCGPVDTVLAHTSQSSPRDRLTLSTVNTNSNHGTSESSNGESIQKKKSPQKNLNVGSDPFSASAAGQPVLCIPESVAYIAGRRSRRQRQLNKNTMSGDLADSSFKMLNLVDCVKNMFFKNSKAYENSSDVGNHACPPKSRSPVNRPVSVNTAASKDFNVLRPINMQELMRPGYITSRKNKIRNSPPTRLDNNKSYPWPSPRTSPVISPVMRDVSKYGPPSLDKEPPPNGTSNRASSEDELWISSELSVCSNIPIVETPLKHFETNRNSKDPLPPCQEVEYANKVIPHYSDAIRRRFTQNRCTKKDEATELYPGLRWDDQMPFNNSTEEHDSWMSHSFDDARIHINDFNFTGEFDIQFEKYQYPQPNPNDDDPDNIISSFERMMQDKKPCYAEQCGLHKAEGNSASSQKLEKTDGNNSSSQCEFLEADFSTCSGPQAKEKTGQDSSKFAVEPEGKDHCYDVCQNDAGHQEPKSFGSRTTSPARSYGARGEQPDEGNDQNWSAVEEEQDILREYSDGKERQAELAQEERSEDYFSEGTVLEGSYDAWYEQTGEDTCDDVETIEDDDRDYQEIGDDGDEDEDGAEEEEEDEEEDEDEELEGDGEEEGNEEEDDNEEEDGDEEDGEHNKNGNNNEDSQNVTYAAGNA